MKLHTIVNKSIFSIMSLLFSGLILADIAKYDELVNGSLSETEAQKEMVSFSLDFKLQRENRKPLYPLYKSYIDKVGSKRIADFLEIDTPSCHGVAHSLGRIVGERVEELNIGMGICGSTCTYACLHGVFKVYFSKLGKDYGHHGKHNQHGAHSHHDREDKQQKVDFSDDELKKFGTDVNKACEESNSIVEGFYKGNCAHGVGHAMGRLAQDTALANKYCRVFTSRDMQYYCETGVFMEYASKIKDQLYTKKYKRSEKIKIALDYCGSESFYPSACLRFLLPRNKSLGHVSRYSYYCAKQEGYLKNHCYNAMGYHSRSYIANNPEEFQYVCSMANTEQKQACISGVSLMKKGQKYRKKIKLACSVFESESQKSFCTKQASNYYYKLENDYFSQLVNPS